MPTTTVSTSMSRVGQGPRGSASTSHEGEDRLRETVRDLLGSSVRLSEQLSTGDVGLYSGAPHSATGLAYALHGRASVVSIDVATKLASFEDPIKSIMPVAVHSTNRIIVKRKYVVGGAASIVPERAAAKTISVKEDEREIMLTRYGADLEMNLNLFNRPDEARSELDMKLDAQRAELENTMVRLGYEEIMRAGTNLTIALARTSPSMSSLTDTERQNRIDRIYMHSVFGALAKHDFPFQNILGAAARAGVYMPSRAGQAVMIVPPCIAVSKLTQRSAMNFSVSGLNVAQNKVEVPLNNAYVDPTSNVRVMVHVPPPTNAPAGAAFPEVTNCGLMNVTSWGTFYPMMGNSIKITDFAKRTYTSLTEEKWNAAMASYHGGAVPNEFTGDDVVKIWIRPKMTCVTQSAILCTQPGSGELLMAYPQTGVSTSQTLETMRMQLRVYLGAAVYNSDHYVVIPDVAFDGLVSGHTSNICMGTQFNPDEHGLIAGCMKKDTDILNILEDDVFRKSCGKFFYSDYYDLKDNAGSMSDDQAEPEANYPLVLYQGRTWVMSPQHLMVEATSNLGHLEHLDAPEYCDVLDGMQKFVERSERSNIVTVTA